MTDDATTPTRRSRRRRFWLVVLVLTLVFLLARTGLDLWAGHRVDQEVAKLEQRYGTVAENSLRLDRVPSADNRARAVRAAVALTVFEIGSPEHRAVERFLGLRTSPPVPADVRAFVEANRAAIRVAEDSRTRRQANWEIEPSGFNTPPWMELRTLSNAISLASLLALADERPDDAAKAVSSGLAVSSSLRQERNLIAQLIRIAVTAMQFRALQHLIVQAEPSKAALEDVARSLAENRTPAPMAVGLLSEIKYAHASWLSIAAGGAKLGALVGPNDSPPSWTAATLARLSRPLIRLAHARYLQHVGRLLDIQTGPRPRSDLGPTIPASPWPGLTRFDLTFTAGLERAIESGDQFTSELNAAELAVALRRFRLDRGRYPDELPALVPEYLASVPIDPFTGRPPVYARKGAGFELHAEGPKNRTPRPPALDWVVPR